MKRYLLLAVFFACGLVVSESIATERVGLFGRIFGRRRPQVRVQAPFVDIQVGNGFSNFGGQSFISQRELQRLRLLQLLRQRQQVQQFDLNIRVPIQVQGGRCNGFY
jgi:hypothetical protein